MQKPASQALAAPCPGVGVENLVSSLPVLPATLRGQPCVGPSLALQLNGSAAVSNSSIVDSLVSLLGVAVKALASLPTAIDAATEAIILR